MSTSTLGAGARLALWRGPGFVLSAQLSAESGLERSAPTLDRRFGPRHEAEGRLLLGRAFDLYGLEAFAEAQAGWRWRSGRHADEALLDLTLGVRPMPGLLVLLQSFNALGAGREAQGAGRAAAAQAAGERGGGPDGALGGAGRRVLRAGRARDAAGAGRHPRPVAAVLTVRA